MDTIDAVQLALLTVRQSPRYDGCIFNPPVDNPWPLTVEPGARLESTSLGRLDKLPLEILHMVLSLLSYIDVINLRRTTSRATSVLLSLPEYASLTKYAPQILNGLWMTKLAPHFTLRQLYDVLTSSRCAFCRRFGGYVFLPSLQRCCIACGEYNVELMPISRDVARRNFGVNRKVIQTLPQMHTVPGQYGTSDGRSRFYERGLVLVSQGVARNHGCRIPDERTISLQNVSRAPQRHMVVAPMVHLNLSSGKAETGLRCKACISAYSAHQYSAHHYCADICNRGMFHEGEWQFLRPCRGTFFKSDPSLAFSMVKAMSMCPNGIAYDMLYDPTDFTKHLGECTEAQKLWHQEQRGGTLPPVDSVEQAKTSAQ